MPDEIQEQPEVTPEDDVHGVGQVLIHVHGRDTTVLGDFFKTILEEIDQLVQKRVEETEGVWIPEPFGLKPGEGELTDEDIRMLLNPEGSA